MQREVVTNLLSLLEGDNDLTRCWAAKALGKIGAQDAAPSLIERLYQDADPDVRMEAAAALGMLASAEATEALIDSLHHDSDGDVKIQACIALGRIGDARALDTLITSLTEDEPLGVDDWGAGDEIEFSATWEIQHQALNLLGDIGDGRAVDTVMRLMQDDTYEDLQELGFRVLAKIGGDQAQDFLLQQLQEGGRLARRRAAKALTYVQNPEVVQGLTRALRDRDPEVCIAAAWALAESREPSVVAWLIHLLKHLHEDVRREAAAVVATLPGNEVEEHLLHLLDDRKRSVRQQAVQVLGERRDVRATDKLLNLLVQLHTEKGTNSQSVCRCGRKYCSLNCGAQHLETSQDDAAFCHELIKALEHIGAPEATIPLCRLFKHGQIDATTRLRIVLALGNTVKETEVRADEESDTTAPIDPVDILIASIGDEDEKVCLAALFSLEKIGGAKVSEALVQALRGELPEAPQEMGTGNRELEPEAVASPAFPTSTLAAIQTQYAASTPDDHVADRRRMVRRHAAKMVRETDDPAIADALLQAAEDEDVELRRQALIALGHIGKPGGIPVALRSLIADSREVQLAAIEALEMLRPAEAVDSLMTVLREGSDPFVTQRAIEVLGTLGDQRATGLIAQRLHDADRQVRRVALEALAALGDRGVIGNIRPLIFDHSGDLRTEAVSALKKLGDIAITGELLKTLDNPEDEENHWIAIEALAELYKTA